MTLQISEHPDKVGNITCPFDGTHEAEVRLSKKGRLPHLVCEECRTLTQTMSRKCAERWLGVMRPHDKPAPSPAPEPAPAPAPKPAKKGERSVFDILSGT